MVDKLLVSLGMFLAVFMLSSHFLSFSGLSENARFGISIGLCVIFLITASLVSVMIDKIIDSSGQTEEPQNEKENIEHEETIRINDIFKTVEAVDNAEKRC